jgi:hypothetical protein
VLTPSWNRRGHYRYTIKMDKDTLYWWIYRPCHEPLRHIPDRRLVK